ncbi:MAG TPA: GTPase [Patescibacteria group bacterium]|nr:GTPase [Patescibacteria group bacterium]
MSTIQEQIESIQKEIRETPYHKGTEHHIGMLRARLSRLKDKQFESVIKSKGGGGGGYSVKHQGDATVVLVGPPSVGKSTLINQLTNARSKVAPYAFTTVTVIPGMMVYKDARIQILDVPGLIEGAEIGKGRGREVLSVVRGADLLIIMTDNEFPNALEKITDSLEKHGIRINKKKPQILIDKKLKGGITIHSNHHQEIGKETIKEVVSEMGIKNAEITINEKVDLEQLIDATSRNRVYIPAIYLLNKVDLLDESRKNNDSIDQTDTSNESIHLQKIFKVSAQMGIGIEELKDEVLKTLGLIRIYLIKHDDEPGDDQPMVVKNGYDLGKILEKIGEEFSENIIKAKIWGTGSKFPGQEVSLKTKVEDGMKIRFI